MEKSLTSTMSRPPQFLYHYTSQRGMLGIINSRKIWASDILYLNDATEFELALKLAVSVIKARPSLSAYVCRPREAVPSSQHQEILTEDQEEGRVCDDLLNTINHLIPKIKLHICVCSFSQKYDSLSQWRGYGNGEAAYSIGFPWKAIQRLAYNREFLLEKCIYRPREQEDFIKRLVQHAIDKARDPNISIGKIDVTSHQADFLLNLLRYAPIIKDKAFEEEREWRLISPPLSKVKFRQGLSMIVPYILFPLTMNAEENTPLSKITIGPTPHPELSCASVKSFLSSKGLGNVNVVPSTAPYRNW